MHSLSVVDLFSHFPFRVVILRFEYSCVNSLLRIVMILLTIELRVTANNGDNTASIFALLCCVSLSSAFMAILCSGKKQRVLRS